MIPTIFDKQPVVRVLLLAIFITGCASLPTDYPLPQSSALQDYRSTALGRRWFADEVRHPGQSAFALLRYGRDAFSIRMALIDQAEKTLDLQVYIWQADATGQIMAEHLLRAADRGVRVRLLVDDLGLAATDAGVAAMDAHPNIEIRFFNPFVNRKVNELDFIIDLNRVNHRMHNKMIVADNSFAVVGGRNVGDHYFGVNSNTNFRDLDIMMSGPIVRDISNVLDYFWNGDWSVPVSMVVKNTVTPDELAHERIRLRERIAAGDYPYDVEDDIAEILYRIKGQAIWAAGKVVWDDPAAIREGRQVSDLTAALRRKVDSLEKSYIIESAYFVVQDSGVENVKKMVDRGVSVRVLTNSLASNDVLAAHAGHAKFRKGLLKAGAELYELRPDSNVIKKTWSGESRAGLHTKAMVFDDESLFIGSFNLDPRSAYINTEAGIYVESPELAQRLLAYMDEGVLPKNSYRVTLDESDQLVWTTAINGEEVRYFKDPLSTFSQRFMSGFIGLLPVDSQL